MIKKTRWLGQYGYKIKVLDNSIELNLSAARNSDLEDLKSCEHVREIEISSSKEPLDLSRMTHISGLEILDLRNCKIKDVSVLKEFTELKSLILEKCRLSDVRFLTDFKQLHYLNLSDNGIEEIPFLLDMPELEMLYLRDNKLRNIDFLSELKSLELLVINDNKLENINGIKGLNKLRNVDFSSNHIVSIDDDINLSKIPKIKISHNKIEQLDLEQFSECEYIIADNNPFYDTRNLYESGLPAESGYSIFSDNFGKIAGVTIAQSNELYEELSSLLERLKKGKGWEYQDYGTTYQIRIFLDRGYSFGISLGAINLIDYCDKKTYGKQLSSDESDLFAKVKSFCIDEKNHDDINSCIRTSEQKCSLANGDDSTKEPVKNLTYENSLRISEQIKKIVTDKEWSQLSSLAEHEAFRNGLDQYMDSREFDSTVYNSVFSLEDEKLEKVFIEVAFRSNSSSRCRVAETELAKYPERISKCLVQILQDYYEWGGVLANLPHGDFTYVHNVAISVIENNPGPWAISSIKWYFDLRYGFSNVHLYYYKRLTKIVGKTKCHDFVAPMMDFFALHNKIVGGDNVFMKNTLTAIAQLGKRADAETLAGVFNPADMSEAVVTQYDKTMARLLKKK